MALITGRVTFSAGSTILAADQNTNDGTVWNLVNGNIDNANIASSAAIAYSKLTLTGSIVNADINASAAIVGSKLNLTAPGVIGSVTPSTGAFSTLKVGTTNQGDILYDNGTTFVRLTPGTSGQYLKTQGSSANPIWADNPQLSNCLFQYNGSIGSPGTGANKYGESTQAITIAYASTVCGNRFLASCTRNIGSAAGDTVTASKWKKFDGVSTWTIYGKLWSTASGNSDQAKLRIDVGGQYSEISSTANSTTPTWYSVTLDVSSLSNGTVYDVTVSLGQVPDAQSTACCSNIMCFGS